MRTRFVVSESFRGDSADLIRVPFTKRLAVSPSKEAAKWCQVSARAGSHEARTAQRQSPSWSQSPRLPSMALRHTWSARRRRVCSFHQHSWSGFTHNDQVKVSKLGTSVIWTKPPAPSKSRDPSSSLASSSSLAASASSRAGSGRGSSSRSTLSGNQKAVAENSKSEAPNQSSADPDSTEKLQLTFWPTRTSWLLWNSAPAAMSWMPEGLTPSTRPTREAKNCCSCASPPTVLKNSMFDRPSPSSIRTFFEILSGTSILKKL
mmetsp:Transcript_135599/g.421272  ORF Transcript_135599/g.421272 Transcript_135599/m.421272 type:complete len:262 (-) Transcript_135599:232-1017(-)